MYKHQELQDFKCKVCGKQFKRYDSQSLKNSNIFCSLECEYKYNGKNSWSRGYSYELKKLILEFSIENEKFSIRRIAKIFGVNKDLPTKIIKQYGNRKPKKLISYNRDYFKKIDTEQKAYWLGFAYADGCVSKSGSYDFDITLKYSDKKHLEKFAKEILYEGKIKKRVIKLGNKEHEACRIILSSEDLCKDLIKLGCGINKTFNLKFPTYNQVPKNLMRHFLRGVTDGDGTLGIYNNRFYYSVISTESFLVGMINFFKHEINDLGNINTYYKDKRLNNDVTKYFSKNGKYAKKIISYLYKDASIYLDRKYDIAKGVVKN